jgi:hypothetical protein
LDLLKALVCPVDVLAGERAHELVAPEAADHVVRPQVMDDRVGDVGQELIAGAVVWVVEPRRLVAVARHV